MDTKNDLLKNGWITLLASLVVVTVLALPGRVNAAVDVGYAVAYGSIGSITR